MCPSSLRLHLSLPPSRAGRRIRHKTAQQKLADWQAEAKERELEKVAMKHLKEAARKQRQEEREQVDIHEVRQEQAQALNGVLSAVRDAVATGVAAGSGTGAEVARKAAPPLPPAAKKRRIDPLAALDEFSSDDEASDDKAEEAEEAPAAKQPAAKAAAAAGKAAGGEGSPAGGSDKSTSEDFAAEPAAAAAAAAATPTQPQQEPQAEQPAEQQQQEAQPAAEHPPIDLADYESAEALEAAGLDRLKAELQRRGLKAGGTLAQRAQRLFLLKHTPIEQLDRKHLAPAAKA